MNPCDLRVFLFHDDSSTASLDYAKARYKRFINHLGEFSYAGVLRNLTRLPAQDHPSWPRELFMFEPGDEGGHGKSDGSEGVQSADR